MSNLELNALEVILKGIKKGNKDCQKKLFEIHYGKLMSICMRYSDSEDEAKDLVQESFIKIFKNIDAFSGEGSFESWMNKITSNTCLDKLRQHKQFHFRIDQHDYFELSNEDEEEIHSLIPEVKAEVILAEIQKLSPSYKLVFNLYVMDELSHNEIAERLGISVGASKSNLARAKARLQKALLKYYNKTEENV
jgi:RNA polymerase sigma-70 factor (ECF subfamily)